MHEILVIPRPLLLGGVGIRTRLGARVRGIWLGVSKVREHIDVPC